MEPKCPKTNITERTRIRVRPVLASPGPEQRGCSTQDQEVVEASKVQNVNK